MPSKPNPPRMLERGLLCLLIGAAVLIAPHFLSSPMWRETIGGAYIVGWFAVVLGVALVAVDLVQRVRR
jgi:hypothetical protein